MFTLAPRTVNSGNLRETFFLNQTGYEHSVCLPGTGDFLVDNRYVFEVGGKNKTRKQIAGLENAFVVKDDIETGVPGCVAIVVVWVFVLIKPVADYIYCLKK